MKKKFSAIVIVFIISLALCGEDEKYTFIWGNGKWSDLESKLTYRTTHEISFTIPEIGFVKYSGQYFDILEYVGVEGEFWKFKATLTEVENNNIVNGIEILDQYAAAMENNSCYLYVKNSGFDDEIHHVEPVKEEHYYLQEAFEAAYMNIQPRHFRYPFGRAEHMLKVGDVVSYTYDSLKFYVNMGSPPSLLSTKITWTFKKVKHRGGRKIALVENKESLTLDLRVAVNFMGEKQLMSGRATGTADATYKWDLDSDDLLQSHVNINLVGDFEMDGETFNMKIFQRFISKKVK